MRPEPPITRSADNTPAKKQKTTHTLIPLRALTGYKGKRQNKCSICRHDAGFCCLECSTADKVFVVHPETTIFKKKKVFHTCYADHCKHPSSGKAVRPVGAGSSRTNSGRGRGRPTSG